MTLSELKQKVDAYLDGSMGSRDQDVVVSVIQEGSVGGTPCTLVTNAHSGFDWDGGKFILTTEEPVIKVSTKIKQKVMTKNEIKKYLYRNRPWAKKVASTDKVYLYHADIDQFYVVFRVPVEDMGEILFEDKIPAQLLIRWLV